MVNFWVRVTWLLDLLVWRVHKYDDNGMELKFTYGKESLNLGPKKSQKLDDFKAKMDKARPTQGLATRTDMKANLSLIIDKHIRDHPRLERKLLLMVLTDGVWEGMNSEHEVDNYLVDVLLKLNEIVSSDSIVDEAETSFPGTSATKFQDRPISVEFIRFGHDQKAIERLDRLDNQLKYRLELEGKAIRYATVHE